MLQFSNKLDVICNTKLTIDLHTNNPPKRKIS